MAAWWETVLSVGAGGAFAMGGQWVQAHLTTKRETEARQEERSTTLLSRRHEFELKQLHELREQLPKLVAPMGMIAEGYEVGELDPTEPHPPLVAGVIDAIEETKRQVALVLDRDVARAVRELTDLAAKIAEGSAYDVERVRQLMLAANEAIGLRIRIIYGPDPTKETPE